MPPAICCSPIIRPGADGVAAASFILPSGQSGHRVLLEVSLGLFVFALGLTVPVGRWGESGRSLALATEKVGSPKAGKGEARKCGKVIRREVCPKELGWH